MKISAPASCGPTREMALLIAEASPELWAGTEVISAVVSGATVIMMPMPKRIPPGSTSAKYDSGGMSDDGWLSTRCQPVLEAGKRAYQSTPSAMIAGPIAMNQRGPYLPARAPNREDPKIKKRKPGTPAMPAAAALYPS